MYKYRMENKDFKNLIESSRKLLARENDSFKTKGLTEKEQKLLYEGMMVLNEKSTNQPDPNVTIPLPSGPSEPDGVRVYPKPYSAEWFELWGYINVAPGIWCQPLGPCYQCDGDWNCDRCEDCRPDDMPGEDEPSTIGPTGPRKRRINPGPRQPIGD